MSELNISSELLQVSAEVQQALKNNQPIVALESTIISHGMPFLKMRKRRWKWKKLFVGRGRSGNHCDYPWGNEGRFKSRGNRTAWP